MADGEPVAAVVVCLLLSSVAHTLQRHGAHTRVLDILLAPLAAFRALSIAEKTTISAVVVLVLILTSPMSLKHPIRLPRQPLHPLILPIIQILRRKLIILLLHIYLPLLPPNPQLLVFGQLLDFPVVTFVAERCCGREEEGAENHGGDEGQAEEGEGVFGEGGAVAGGDGGGVGGWAEFLGGEGRHRGSIGG
jgi:hypothetical protein